jgi:hypothetical protein
VFVSSTWPFTALTGLLAVVVVVLVVAAVIGVAVRGRNEGSRRAGPAGFFLFGLSLLFLGVIVGSAGAAVHAVSELVGPASGSANFGDFPGDLGLPPCSGASSSSSNGPTSTLPAGTATATPTSATTVPDDIPCIDYGSSDSPSPIYSSSSGLTYSSSGAVGSSFAQLTPVNELNLFSNDSTNHSISVAVAAVLFGIAALVGYVLVWPRARLLVAESDLDDRLDQFALGYAYLVAGLSAISLLVFVPFTADSVFRAIAPGVNQMSGHAEGVRSLVTFLTLSAIAGAILVYHLRLAQDLRDPGILEVNGIDDEIDDPDETTSDDTTTGSGNGPASR